MRGIVDGKEIFLVFFSYNDAGGLLYGFWSGATA